MAMQEITLPKLRPNARFNTVPRRYEETRPVVVQSSTHHSIVGMGHDFHRNLLQACEKDKQQTVEAAESAVWLQAEVLKQEAVEAAVNSAEASHAKTIKKLHKIHEKTLKEELINLSTKMDRQRLEAVKQAKAEGERAVEEAIHRTEQLWQNKLIQAVDSARCEEKQAAREEAARVERVHQRALESLRQKLDREKAEALSLLGQEKEKEKLIAVATAREEEQKIAQDKISHLRRLYEQQITVLQSHIDERNRKITDLHSRIEEICRHRSRIQEELQQTRDEFQNFIDVVKPFNDSEAKYLIPPIKTFNAI